jgi:hypothetical protein
MVPLSQAVSGNIGKVVSGIPLQAVIQHRLQIFRRVVGFEVEPRPFALASGSSLGRVVDTPEFENWSCHPGGGGFCASGNAAFKNATHARGMSETYDALNRR